MNIFHDRIRFLLSQKLFLDSLNRGGVELNDGYLSFYFNAQYEQIEKEKFNLAVLTVMDNLANSKTR
ncbi:hypothetical protein HY214_00420 [Candidatus Roizmanbacteria bacterium]|nr:hypothetical protein [Candidatus Roizmanbacteria bacterium]